MVPEALRVKYPQAQRHASLDLDICSLKHQEWDIIPLFPAFYHLAKSSIHFLLISFPWNLFPSPAITLHDFNLRFKSPRDAGRSHYIHSPDEFDIPVILFTVPETRALEAQTSSIDSFYHQIWNQLHLHFYNSISS